MVSTVTSIDALGWSPGIALRRSVSGSMQAVGGLFAMSADAVKLTVRRSFQWRECLEQARFVARVSVVYAFMSLFVVNVVVTAIGIQMTVK
jgi:phospholipid/cholesterol/gamma-HCH transport system permease protein